MDGSKVINKEKFLEKWKKGSIVDFKFSKPTSWSTSKEVASLFMVDQDRNKNKKEGFHVLLKLENPTIEEVVADLRNFDLSRFWNQQELIIEQKVKRFKVEEIFPYEDSDYSNFKKLRKNRFSSLFGFSKEEILKNFFDLRISDLDLETKLYFKKLKDLDLNKVLRIYKINFKEFQKLKVSKTELMKLSFPLYLFYYGFFSFLKPAYVTKKVLNSKEILFNLRFNFDETSSFYAFESGSEFLTKNLIYDKGSSKFPNSFISQARVKLIKSEFYNFVFEVELLGEFFTENENEWTEEVLKALNSELDFFNLSLIEEINTFAKRYKSIKVNYIWP